MNIQHPTSNIEGGSVAAKPPVQSTQDALRNTQGSNCVIVLCYPVEARHLQAIAEASPDAEVIDAGQEAVAEALLEADVFCGHAKVPVDWDEVVRRGRLRWIQSSAAGLDHCLTPSVIDSDIVVTGASGLFVDQVAEQTLALILGLVRSFPVFFRAQQNREFVRRPTGDLHGSTVGIVGFGGNGRRIAEVLAPFRVQILAVDRFPLAKPDFVDSLWPAERLDDLLAVSDIVILCVPLNSQTQGMIDARSFALMKPSAMLINVARGPVVVERDLVKALAQQRIAAAGLDVTEVEPLHQESPLWEMPQVLITPHVGAQSKRRYDDVTSFFCENLRRDQTGQPFLNLVDKQLGFPRPEHRWANSSRT